MNRARRIGILALAAALGACGSAEPEPTASGPTGSSTPTESSTPQPTGLRVAQVVYPTLPSIIQEQPGVRDLWLYEPAHDSTRRLTDDGDLTRESDPRFRDADHVTYVVYAQDGPETREQLYEIDIRTGETSPLFEPADITWSFDWDPSGQRLAMIVNTGRTKAVQIYAYDTGTTTSIFELPGNIGRGGVPEDEIAATWSPDGSYLVITDTAGDQGRAGGSVDAEPPIYVIDASGDVVLDGIAGTQARWSADSSTVYFRSYSGSGTWSYGHIASRETGKLPIEAERQLYPSVSPSGRYLAYSDEGVGARVRVLDLRTGEERVVAHDAIAPVWLSNDTVAVNEVVTCGDDSTCGEYPRWRTVGRAIRVDISSGERARLALHHTGGVGGPLDVWLS